VRPEIDIKKPRVRTRGFLFIFGNVAETGCPAVLPGLMPSKP
jgi:hypothetical protein